MNGDGHIIWSNRNLDFEEWREELEDEFPDAGEEELITLMYDINNEYLQDSRTNLNIELKNPIIVIADIGRWNGRFPGYREFESGNISDCLYTELDYATWYVDKNGDFRCDGIHHDGENHYLYREYRDGISEHQKELFREKIYEGTATKKDIERYTRRLGDRVAEACGFSLVRKKEEKER